MKVFIIIMSNGRHKTSVYQIKLTNLLKYANSLNHDASYIEYIYSLVY